MSAGKYYCPYCCRVIAGEPVGDVYLFVHDDIVHPDDFDQEEEGLLQ